jgi:hypothetical protein
VTGTLLLNFKLIVTRNNSVDAHGLGEQVAASR